MPSTFVRPVRPRLDGDLASSAQVTSCNFRPVSLRICFVTPFAWSQPHEVNAHVDGAATALRARGHDVTILAPSSRGRDLLAGRRALQRGADADVIAVGPSIPLSRRTNMGVPVAVRANLRLALTKGRFDVVHGFEPGLPEPLLPRAHVDPRADGGDVLLRRPARLPGSTVAPRSSSGARRRAPRDVGGNGRGGERAVRGRLPARPARRGHRRSSDLGAEAGPDRDRARSPRAASTTRAILRLLDDAARMGGHAAPHEAARLPAGGAASGSRTRARPRGSQHAAAGRRARGCAIFVAAPGGEERLALEAAASGAAIVVAETANDVAHAVDRLARDCGAAVERGRQSAAARGDTELRRGRRRARRALLPADAEAAPRAERGRGSARRPRLDHDRPAHAHRLVARLLDPGRGSSSITPRRSGSEGSRSPTTTSSAARSRRRSWRATAI